MKQMRTAAHSLLTTEELEFQDTVQKFMQKEVAPLVTQMEGEGRPPASLLRRMGREGLLGTYIPEEYGGSGASLMTRAIVAEETARTNAGLDATIFVNISLVANHFLKYGTQ